MKNNKIQILYKLICTIVCISSIIFYNTSAMIIIYPLLFSLAYKISINTKPHYFKISIIFILLLMHDVVSTNIPIGLTPMILSITLIANLIINVRGAQSNMLTNILLCILTCFIYYIVLYVLSIIIHFTIMNMGIFIITTTLGYIALSILDYMSQNNALT